MKKRKFEYFEVEKKENYKSYSNVPPQLMRQERDWTCSVAAVRTILSAFKEKYLSETSFIANYNLTIGEHYTEEILSKKLFGENKKILSHLDFKKEELSLKLLNNLLAKKYYIMAECMYNYAHWVVILAYLAVRGSSDTEEHQILFYDPYYDETRLVRADEFATMWCDPDGHYREFIAVCQMK
jgi:hypothetical protein